MGALDRVLDAESRKSATIDPVQTAMVALLNRFAPSNRDLAEGVVKALEAMQAETTKLVKSLDQSGANGEITAAIKGLADGQSKLAGEVAKLVNAKPVDNSSQIVAAVDNLRTALQAVSMPEPDMTPVMAELRRLGQRGGLSGVLARLDAIEQRLSDESWDFVPEREDFSDKITRIRAKRVA